MEEWIEEMHLLAANDYRHKEFVALVDEMEPQFQKLRAKLTEEEQEFLDLYISNCEHLNYTYIYAAYQLGWHKHAVSAPQTIV